jgi:hypothetical protein
MPVADWLARGDWHGLASLPEDAIQVANQPDHGRDAK